MEAIEDTCPLEDRTRARVFQGITEASAYQAMTRACKNAKVPHYHPHDLRHRRITIWHQSGVPARELAERAGHARPSMSLDVYSHVMPPDEIASDRSWPYSGTSRNVAVNLAKRASSGAFFFAFSRPTVQKVGSRCHNAKLFPIGLASRRRPTRHGREDCSTATAGRPMRNPHCRCRIGQPPFVVKNRCGHRGHPSPEDACPST